jgi:hypothetical protein
MGQGHLCFLSVIHDQSDGGPHILGQLCMVWEWLGGDIRASVASEVDL